MSSAITVLEPPPSRSEIAECACCPPGTKEPAGLEVIDLSIGRREFISTMVIGGAGAALLAACGDSDDETAPGGTSEETAQPRQLVKMDLAYCSQVLCGVPLEVAVKQGLFKEQGYDVTLVYQRGGAVAMNALLSNSIDWVLTPMDLVVSAWGSGKQAVMFASASSLPFFALVTGPRSSISSIADLKGKTVGVGNLNTTDHLLVRAMVVRAGLKESDVEIVPVGTNQFDAVVRGQVDAGMVQEPARTLIERQGGKVLVNLMKRGDADATLGGAYQFTGLISRPDVLQNNPEQARKLAAAIAKANQWVRTHSGAETVKNIPEELVAGGDDQVFATVLDQVKLDLYPANLRIDEASVQRVVDVQKMSGALQMDVKAADLFTNQYVG